MVVYERAIGCVDIMVWGEVSGGRGDGGNERHLRGKWRDVVERKGRVVRVLRGSVALGPGTDRGQGGTTWSRIYAFQITKQVL